MRANVGRSRHVNGFTGLATRLDLRLTRFRRSARVAETAKGAHCTARCTARCTAVGPPEKMHFATARGLSLSRVQTQEASARNNYGEGRGGAIAPQVRRKNHTRKSTRLISRHKICYSKHVSDTCECTVAVRIFRYLFAQCIFLFCRCCL